MSDVCMIQLPGNRNYAVISPGRIAFGLGASPKELATLVSTGLSHPGCCKKDGGCGKKHGG